MFAIQWYDPYDLTRAGRAKKDGKPTGSFETKQQAEERAEQLCTQYGIDLPYKIVPLRIEPRTVGYTKWYIDFYFEKRIIRTMRLKDLPDNTKFRFLKGQEPARNYVTTYVTKGDKFYAVETPVIVCEISEYQDCKVRKVKA